MGKVNSAAAREEPAGMADDAQDMPSERQLSARPTLFIQQQLLGSRRLPGLREG